ncbi:MAG: tetratricopeptide repeat protein [Pseudomonadales bacterium]|nr:tetratricopeptide repeat protein [Pseudomonadales bacterium]
MTLNIKQLLRKAKAHLKQGETEIAAQCYKEILKEYPHNKQALSELKALQQPGQQKTSKANRPSPKQISKLVAMCDQQKFEEALSESNILGKQFPKFAMIPNMQGAIHDTLGRHEQAVSSYRNALRIESGNALAQFNLGNALQQLGDLEQAAANFDKSIQLNPKHAEAYIGLANVFFEMGMVVDSIAAYRKALVLKPNNPEAHKNLGRVLRVHGDTEAAISSLRKAVSLNPDYAEAHRILAVAKKSVEYDDDVKAMEAAYRKNDLSDSQRMHLAFGLGKSYEDLGLFERAFEFYEVGNAKKRETFDYSVESAAKMMEELKSIFTKDFSEKHKNAGINDDTPIFILGMPRSGNSLVEQIIASHKNVYGAGELNHVSRIAASIFNRSGELNFGKNIRNASAEDFSQAGRKYIDLVSKNCDSEKFVTDKMPLNFLRIGIIKLMLPKSRIIHCCRDSRDTCWSIFKSYFPTEGNRYAYNLQELGNYYKLYNDLMNHWHKLFPNVIYDIHYENLVANQEEQSRSLLAYCGLDWDDSCLKFYETDRVVTTASATQVRSPMYKSSIQTWKKYEKWLTPLLDILDD